jgi:hypothetical protein
MKQKHRRKICKVMRIFLKAGLVEAVNKNFGFTFALLRKRVFGH